MVIDVDDDVIVDKFLLTPWRVDEDDDEESIIFIYISNFLPGVVRMMNKSSTNQPTRPGEKEE